MGFFRENNLKSVFPLIHRGVRISGARYEKSPLIQPENGEQRAFSDYTRY